MTERKLHLYQRQAIRSMKLTNMQNYFLLKHEICTQLIEVLQLGSNTEVKAWISDLYNLSASQTHGGRKRTDAELLQKKFIRANESVEHKQDTERVLTDMNAEL